MTSSALPDRGAFYGRRKGHRLRKEQAGRIEDLLPNLRIDTSAPIVPTALFAQPVEDLWLEIGFGGGEHLLSNLRALPNVGHIGCEPFVNGMAKLLSAIDQEGLSNVRLHDGDALEVLKQLPDASLGRVYLLYPDPWPKRRHHKRRFVSDAMLVELARVIRPGGEFRFASDIDHYVGWTLTRLLRSEHFDWVAETADEWRKPWAGWPGTRYEAKAFREGRVPSYIISKRR